MKTSEPSQATLWQETELPLMSSREVSRAKTLALLESAQVSEKEPAAVSGPRSSDLLASYHPATSSWRTSQTCLVALARNEGDGLAEFSGTWPSAGMMRNGKAFELPILGRHTGAPASGLLPTPTKSDGYARASIWTPNMEVKYDLDGRPRLVKESGDWSCGLSRFWMHIRGEELPTDIVETMMGFPIDWTALPPSETPSSRRSPK